VARFAEFFAGIGLVREAIEPLGWECVFANDISRSKAEMYAARFGHKHLLVEDIHRVSISDLPPDIELLTASFPCIDLSLAGNRAGLAGRHSSTIWAFLDMVSRLSERRSPPTALLLENVTGFLTSKGGRDLADVAARIAQLGYKTDLVVVDARWFTPQSRPRVFVVAVHNEQAAIATPPTGHTSRLRPASVRRFEFRNRHLPFIDLALPEPPTRSPVSLVSVLEDVSEDDSIWWTADQVLATVQAMSPIHRTRVEGLLKGKQHGIATMYRRVRDGRTVGEVRADTIAGCLRTPLGGSSVQFLVDCRCGNTRIRPLTGREYARLQGAWRFPISVGRRQARMCFGDAVCVPAVRWLVDHALGFILGCETDPTGVQLRLAAPAAACATQSGHALNASAVY